MKLYNKGIRAPGKITQIKQRLENDDTLSKIGKEKIHLENFLFRSKKQKIEGTKILADVFEAVCGAIFLDSGNNIRIIEEKIINRFFPDFLSIVQDSKIFQKNQFIEYLQKLYRITPRIECDYQNKGSDHEPKWIAKNPKIFPENLQIILPIKLKSKPSKSIQEAEQDLYNKIYNYLQINK